jgi:hypothetical protein
MIVITETTPLLPDAQRHVHEEGANLARLVDGRSVPTDPLAGRLSED